MITYLSPAVKILFPTFSLFFVWIKRADDVPSEIVTEYIYQLDKM